MRLVVLTGASGHFCAGADISEFSRVRADSTGGAAYEREVGACYEAIRALPQPSVAAVEGSCVGGGCAIALCCDFRVMHQGARFGIPATKLGTIYTIEECRFLFSVVGLANAKRILYGSELFGAVAAQEMGFADAVVDGDIVDSAIAFGRAMMANAPLAVAGTKAILQALATGKVEHRRAEIERLIREALDSETTARAPAPFSKSARLGSPGDKAEAACGGQRSASRTQTASAAPTRTPIARLSGLASPSSNTAKIADPDPAGDPADQRRLRALQPGGWRADFIERRRHALGLQALGPIFAFAPRGVSVRRARSSCRNR